MFYLPSPAPTTLRTSASVTGLGPNQSRSVPFSEVATGYGSLSLSWTSSGAASVSFWAVAPCSGTNGDCPITPALATWSSNRSGNWSVTGTIVAGYLLTIRNADGAALSISVATSESYGGHGSAPAFPVWLFMASGSLLLLVIGSVAVFLGLYLPGGVYSRRGTELDPALELRRPVDLWPTEEDELPPSDEGTKSP